MAGAGKQRKIDDLLSKVRDALDRKSYFEAERMADKALAMARQEQDFQRMIKLIPSLYEARRKRFQLALDCGVVTVFAESFHEDMKIRPGCYLVQPPQVGAEARRLRLAALSRDIPVAVLCREPRTRTGLIPVVAIGPGSTLRAKVAPPDDADNIDLEWFVSAMEALGEWALETIDPEMAVTRRLDTILDALDAIPETRSLHDALEGVCRQAHEEHLAEKSAATAKSAAKSRVKQAPAAVEPEDDF